MEALSRGARSVILVDKERAICQSLRAHLSRLNVENANVIQANALEVQMLDINTPVDIVFCDPPFKRGLLQSLLAKVETLELSENAYIYVESEKQLTELDCPANWQLLKEKTAGDVRYRLYQRQ